MLYYNCGQRTEHQEPALARRPWQNINTLDCQALLCKDLYKRHFYTTMS